MSPNAKPHIYVQFNPERNERNLVVIVKDKPKPEPEHPGIVGSTWME